VFSFREGNEWSFTVVGEAMERKKGAAHGGVRECLGGGSTKSRQGGKRSRYIPRREETQKGTNISAQSGRDGERNRDGMMKGKKSSLVAGALKNLKDLVTNRHNLCQGGVKDSPEGCKTGKTYGA